jgi:CheY-like chemotaxis protein
MNTMPKKLILVVDDEVEFVDLIKMRLEANNYRVAAAYNGNEALDRIREEKPDLILLDVMMPGMSGFDVLKALKMNEATGDIPVVMLTAKGESRSIFKAQELGVTEYLIKPFDSKEAMAVIKRHV